MNPNDDLPRLDVRVDGTERFEVICPECRCASIASPSIFMVHGFNRARAKCPRCKADLKLTIVMPVEGDGDTVPAPRMATETLWLAVDTSAAPAIPTVAE